MEKNIMIERHQLRVRYHVVRLLKKLKEVKQTANTIELAGKLDNTPHLENIEAFEKALKEMITTTLPLKEASRPLSKL